MRPLRRASLLAVALVPIGTIAGHVAGYGLAGRPAAMAGRHAHLQPAAWLASVVALVALGWIAGVRGPRRARVHVGWLAVGQAALFVLLETVEHAVAGGGVHHALTEPAFRWGLGAQIVTAAALALVAVLARFSGDQVRSLLAGRNRGRASARGSVPPVAALLVRCRLLASSTCPRGPPPPLVAV